MPNLTFAPRGPSNGAIEETEAELRDRSAEFVDEIGDAGYALVTHFEMPGGFAVQLYQPHYKK